MVLAVIFVILGVIYGLHKILSTNTPKSCNELGYPHSWTTKDSLSEPYLICERCKFKPSGIIKYEVDKYDI